MASNYHVLGIKQLQAEVYRRSHLPNSKQECIQLLEELDRKSAFRFLDLPAEMRNRVYEELLVHDRGTRSATPQLLRTCRQINNEAKGILYMSSSLTLNATFWVADNAWAKDGEFTRLDFTEEDDEWRKWYNKSELEKEELEAEGYSPPPSPRMNTPEPGEEKNEPRYYRPCLVSGDCNLGDSAAPLLLRDASKFWPRKLCDIPIINLNISLELDPVFSNQDTVPDFLTFNHFLYSMVSSLSGSTRPQTLILSIEDNGLCSQQDLEDYLWPLTKLPENIKLEIAGIDPELITWLEDIRQSKPQYQQYDLLSDCLQLEARIATSAAWNFFDGYPELAKSAALSVEQYINRLIGGLDWDCIEAEDELNCFKAVALAEEAIKPIPRSEALKAAWVAKLRIKTAELKQASSEYWWSWDAIREEPVESDE